MTTAVKHLYRTLLTLDGNHPTVRTAVLDVHYLHDLVMSPYRHRFPNGWNGARQAMEILYATQPQRDSTLKVMIQSGQAPNWAPPDPTILAAEIQHWAFTPDFRPGQIVPFRLRCNPTRTPPTRNHTTPPRNRQFISDPAARLTWLRHQLSRIGAELHDATETPDRADLRSEHKSLPPNQRRTITAMFNISTVVFTGQLTITDPDSVAAGIRTGIGPGKAYGAGLLLTQRT